MENLAMISVAVLSALFAFSSVANAQLAGDGGCCIDYGYSSYSPVDYGTSSYSPIDYGYSSYSPADYGYSSYSPIDYGYSSYSPYDYGNTVSPIYAYDSYDTYDVYGTVSYPIATPVYSAPTVFTPTPHFSFTNPISFSVAPVAQLAPIVQSANQTQTQTQTNPVHINVSPSNPGTAAPAHVTQTQSTGPVTQNQAPITNTNINTVNVPAPVYQAPIQPVVQYTFPTYQAPTCSISVNNAYYNSYSNQSVTLSWTSSNASSAAISPNVGSVNPTGSTTVYPTAGTTIYTMTVYGQGGSATCQTSVVYQQPPVYVPPAPTPASCTISASPASIRSGEYSYLSWNSYNVSSATLSDGIGAVAPSGSLSIRPNSSRDYTLTVYGPQGTNATCHAYVTVGNRTPYVSLTQIPYTGFDFGSFGNAIYWLSLLSFAIAAAYLVVYSKGGMAIFAAGMNASREAKHSHVHGAHSHAVETPATGTQKPSFANLPTREYRNATSDSMSVAQAKSADEMPRIIITRS